MTDTEREEMLHEHAIKIATYLTGLKVQYELEKERVTLFVNELEKVSKLVRALVDESKYNDIYLHKTCNELSDRLEIVARSFDLSPAVREIREIIDEIEALTKEAIINEEKKEND